MTEDPDDDKKLPAAGSQRDVQDDVGIDIGDDFSNLDDTGIPEKDGPSEFQISENNQITVVEKEKNATVLDRSKILENDKIANEQNDQPMHLANDKDKEDCSEDAAQMSDNVGNVENTVREGIDDNDDFSGSHESETVPISELGKKRKQAHGLSTAIEKTNEHDKTSKNRTDRDRNKSPPRKKGSPTAKCGRKRK